VSRGQSLVELAVCAPLVVLLTLGTAAAVQVIDASAGLEAATQAAAAEASRAPDDYPLRSPHLSITVGQFSRTDEVSATASGGVDISWAGMVFPQRLTLNSRAVIPLESWRSHRPAA